MTACRHGNGRDWWILVVKERSNKYYRIRVSPDAPKLIGAQIIGDTIETGIGQAVFSPNGEWYAHYNAIYSAKPNVLDLYRFDRCSGLLSDHQRQKISIWGKPGGIAFSPNSRFMYVAVWDSVYQYDVQAADIFASQKLVAVLDTFLEPLNPSGLGTKKPCRFFTMQLAPDGKIYECSPNYRSRYLHVIEKPDSLGMACCFRQRGFIMPKYNEFSLPTFPFFRLTSVLDCPPDSSVAIDEIETLPEKLIIHPNPVFETAKIQIPQNCIDCQLKLFSITGQLIKDFGSVQKSQTLDIDAQSFEAGVFWCSLFSENQKITTEKMIVIKP